MSFGDKQGWIKIGFWGLVFSSLLACSHQQDEQNEAAKPSSGTVSLLNVSYDVTRDLFKEYNPLFVRYFEQKNPNQKIIVKQSHAGSSKQALAVANGLQADVVTMNQSSDIALLQNKGLVSPRWEEDFPNHAVPFSSTTVFLVRKGNPKNIHDWADLVKPGVKLVMTNPKMGGNGRYTFLAAYGYALKVNHNNDDAAKDYLKQLFSHTAVLEAGGRSATTTFVQRQIGDVLITFENEANVAASAFGDKQQFEVIYPSYSVAVESPVAVVTSVTDKRATTSVAREYLQYLWSDEGQNVAANFYLRPSDANVLAKYQDRFPKVETFRPTDVFGSWADIMNQFFADGGLFDQVNHH